MTTEFYQCFEEDKWPIDRKEAERRACKKGFDTLLCIYKNGTFSGRSKFGIWCAGIPNKLTRIINFLNYEKTYKRRVMLWCEDKEVVHRIIEKINYEDIRQIIDLEDKELLCHSTALENIDNILKDNGLLSYKELVKLNRVVKTERFVLREPEDFLDYVDLCDKNSMSSEIVVASRQFGKIKDDLDFQYNPGVRMYFSVEKLKNLKGACVDGLHTFSVKNKLPLDCVHAIVFSSKNHVENVLRNNDICDNLKNKIHYLDEQEIWTPREFVSKCNELVLN